MCWRTCFLRRMESLAKGIHYNICACARKETTEGWKKTRRYGRALHDTRVSACSTPGSRHVWHPGLGMHDTRVSDTRKRLTELMAQEGDDTETCNEKKDRKKNGRGKDTKKTTRPAEIHDFWMSVYEEIDTIPNKVAQIQKAGYIPVATFILPEYCWTENYFTPLVKAREIFSRKYAGNKTVEELISFQHHEAELYRKYKEFYGYVFYIAKKMK